MNVRASHCSPRRGNRGARPVGGPSTALRADRWRRALDFPRYPISGDGGPARDLPGSAAAGHRTRDIRPSEKARAWRDGGYRDIAEAPARLSPNSFGSPHGARPPRGTRPDSQVLCTRCTIVAGPLNRNTRPGARYRRTRYSETSVLTGGPNSGRCPACPIMHVTLNLPERACSPRAAPASPGA